MGWDESRIVICDLRTGERRVVMGEPETSASHPQWSPDGRTLAFMCDRNGYMNLWRAVGDGSDPRPWVQEPFDPAGPLWGSGQSFYTWSPDGAQIAYLRNEDGTNRLRLLDLASGEPRAIGEADGSYASLRWAPRGGDLLALYFGPTVPPAVVVIDTRGGHQRTLVTAALGGLTGHGSIAPRPIAWRCAGELEVHGLLYEPVGLAGGERPPLLVSVHGGPTGQSSAQWSPVLQYFLQRGWAIFAPNARGSSGYGRAYIQALHDEWGGADMADIAAGIEYVTGQGWADPARVAVWGGSAGGYAVLLLPALYPHLFKAAVSLFGVSDLFSLARTTHRLEAHYLDRIVGGLPEAADRYRERSPVYRAESYGCPVLMLQGDQDVAVTPDQAEMMRDAFARAGKTAILHMYPGEGHGWQHAATVRDYVERMDRFLEEYVLLR
jgi:dipeptidyl aminopeptidase/acylaminoacyl peptidase